MLTTNGVLKEIVRESYFPGPYPTGLSVSDGIDSPTLPGTKQILVPISLADYTSSTCSHGRSEFHSDKVLNLIFLFQLDMVL